MEVLNFISDNQVALIIIAIELLFIWLIKKYRLIGIGICLGIIGISYTFNGMGNLSLNAVLSLLVMIGTSIAVYYYRRYRKHKKWLATDIKVLVKQRMAEKRESKKNS